MRLRATLAHRYWLDKPLCELSNVLESYAWSKPNFVQRRIEAKLHSVTEFWAPFFQEWMRMRQSPLVIEGQSFTPFGNCKSTTISMDPNRGFKCWMIPFS